MSQSVHERLWLVTGKVIFLAGDRQDINTSRGDWKVKFVLCLEVTFTKSNLSMNPLTQTLVARLGPARQEPHSTKSRQPHSCGSFFLVFLLLTPQVISPL